MHQELNAEMKSHAVNEVEMPVTGRSVDSPLKRIPEGCEAVAPEMLALVRLSQHQIDAIVQTVPGGAANVQDIYPLSSLQEGMLFHYLLNSENDTYLVSTLFEVPSRAEADAFCSALQRVITRHDILRTAILWEGLPTPLQVVYRSAALPVEEVQLQTDRDSIEQLKELMRPEHQKLDLTRAPLLRLRITQSMEDKRWFVLLQNHHMICDLQSRKALIAEAIACLEGKEAELPAPIGYRNYVAKVLHVAQAGDSRSFFQSRFCDVTEPTAPFGLLDVHGDGRHIQEARQVLEQELSEEIRVQALRFGVSAARMFHAAWALVVALTSGRDDVVFGTVLSLGRQSKAAPGRMLGMSINTLPVRLRLQQVSANGILEQTDRELTELLDHAAVPLTLAQQCSGIDGAAPLFTTLLNYRHGSSNIAVEQGSAGRIKAIAQRGVWTNYPVAVEVDAVGPEFIVAAQTDQRIDPHRMLRYLSTALRSLTAALRENPLAPALGLAVMPEDERAQVVESFNLTHAPHSKSVLIHQLVEEQAARRPHSIAVACTDQHITYGRLNSRANQVAHALIALGIEDDGRVGVYLERSVEMIVALFGVLKAGGAYMPLDVRYPRDRLEYMLLDSRPVAVVTSERLKEQLPTGVPVITLDAVDERICRQRAQPRPRRTPQTAAQLAYIIYTSGSTGAPKGVAVEHRSVVNLIQWHCATFDLNQECRSSSVAAIGFDAASWEIWPPLTAGATLVIASQEMAADIDALLSWWADEPLDVSFLPTPIAELALSRNIRKSALRTLLVGGDRLNCRTGSLAFTFVNNYGPTETTVVATSGRIDESESALHIGRPIANTQIRILNQFMQPLPVGVAGEIYVGGEGVARGYLGRPELESQRFVPDPFATGLGARMYRTGDLARWRHDGTIEFLGRNDDQVKIRGYRIELGEIESQLARHPQISEAITVVREDAPGRQRLVAYFSAREGTALDGAQLRTYLKEKLPDYMVPSAFMMMDSLPLTPHGKIDRKALLTLESVETEVGGSYVAPEGEVELTLAAVWSSLTGAGRIGRYDNFFDVGGHSLLAVQSLFHINQKLNASLKVTDIYENPTISGLAIRITGGAREEAFVDLSREALLDTDIVGKAITPSGAPGSILLTGGSGFVGRFLLSELLQKTDATIYCLVRASSRDAALTKLRMTLAKWDLWLEDFEPRIVVLPGDLRKPRLGIDSSTYGMLSRSVDTIFHCATSMNHLETYTMAKSANVDSAHEFVRLAVQGRPKLINFISTVGVFSAPTGETTPVDELSSIDNERHLHSRGYAASKWVGEKIFMTANQRRIPCNIFRLGLVWADSQYGRYDELQNVCRIIKSSLLSGIGIRNYRYLMTPTPVDYVARAVVHLAERHRRGGGIFHISSEAGNDSGVSSGLFERCNRVMGADLTLVSHYDWICEMKRLHHEGRSLPAVPLVEYAFSLDEHSFNERQNRAVSAFARVAHARTTLELKDAGIVAPSIDDEFLRRSLIRLIAEDLELRDLFPFRDKSSIDLDGSRKSFAPDHARTLRQC